MVGVAAVSICLALPSSVAHAQRAASPAYDEGVFDLQVTGLPARSVPVLVTAAGQYLLPVRVVAEHLGIPLVLARDSGVVSLTRMGGQGTNAMRFIVPRSLRVGERTTALDSAEVVQSGDEIFLSAMRLASLVEGTIDVELATLTIRATRFGGFPAQLRLDVARRRAVQLRAAERGSSGRSERAVPFEPRSGLGVLEWGLSGSGTGASALLSAAEARVGVGVYGGMVKSRTTLRLAQSGVAAGVSAQELSYQRVFPLNDLVRQVQMGDVVSEGSLARGMRGLTFTNAPFIHGLAFDDMPFSRPLPAGWEYEVYEGSRLVGYADASTTAPLRIPLQYGATPLRVRLYGPAGEVIESAVSYVIPVEQLRHGEWQYAAGAGRCAYGACDGTAYGELRHGVSRWLTLQGGVDGLRDSTGRRVRPYGAASFLPAPGWVASVQGQRAAYLRGSLLNQGDGHVTGGLVTGVNGAGEGGTPLGREPERSWFAQSNLQLRSITPALQDHTISLAARADGGARSGVQRWDVSAVTPVRRILMELAVQSDPRAALTDSAGRGLLLRVAPTISFTRGAFARLGSPVVRVEGGFQRGALAQWDVGASLQPGNAYVSLAIRKLIGVSRPQLSVGGTIPLGVARVLTHLASRNGVVEGGYSATGAVATGSVRRVTPLEYGGLGLAGMEGIVFRDRDGDGRFGAGDTPVAGAVVQIGGLRTRTDERGRYAMWNVTPYEVVQVGLDTLSLEEPAWTSARPQQSLRLSPHLYTRADFPLVHTREVIGRITGPAPLAAPGGVTVTLRESVTGVAYETRTFSDGAFYLSQVRPGSYRLEVAESSLRALRAVLAAQRDIVVKGDGDEVVELAPVALGKDPRSP